MSATTKTKTATPAKAPAKPSKSAKSTGQLNQYDEELAKLARQGVEAEANVGSGTNSITVKNAQFHYGGNLLGTVLRVVALDHSIENCWYPEDYDADNPVPPSCYALGRKESELVPAENCEQRQGGASGGCADCPLNAFGSGDKGRGKACKNTRRIMLILEDGLDDVGNATVALLKPSVTNLKAWASYVKLLEETTKKATIKVVTEINVRPDPKNQYALSFKALGEVDRKLIGALLDKRRENERILFEPYAYVAGDAKKARGAQGKSKYSASTKKASPKKSAPARGRK